MALDGGEALASEDYEAPRMENKRKFDETVNRNWDGGKAVFPAAHVPSCSNVRPPLSELDLVKQSVAEIVARSFAKFKRPRTEEVAEDQSEPVGTNELDQGAALADDYSKCDHNQPAEETLPMHHQQFHQGAQFYNRGNFHQSRKIDVPNLKQASAGGAGVVSGRDFRGPGGSPGEYVKVKVTNDNVTVFMDSAEISRVFNQAPTRTFSIKVSSPSVDSAQILNCELRWEQGL